MKRLLILVSIPAILFSCQPPDNDPKANHSFYITGYKSGLTVDFTSGNRVDSSTPDDVHQLHVQVLDDDNRVVYERYYYDYSDYYPEDSVNYAGDYDPSYPYYDMGIPDTIFIPSLPSGHYSVIAATAYIGGYYYDYDNDGHTDGSNGRIELRAPNYEALPWVESYIVSDGPIYVGKQTLVLDGNEQEVQLNMSNVSAKITVVNSSNPTDGHGWADVMFETRNNQYYNFIDEALLPIEYDYDYPVYTYFDHSGSRDFYVLPKILTSLTINHWDYFTGSNFQITMDLDPDIELNVGDAVTFTINLDEIIAGGGSGTFVWEEIDWNDLGNVTVP